VELGWGPTLDVPVEASVDTVTLGSSWKHSGTQLHAAATLGGGRVPISADPRT